MKLTIDLQDEIAEQMCQQDCGDGSCCWRQARGGMRTNGGCDCLTKYGPPVPTSLVRAVVRAVSKGIMEATK